MQRSACVMFLAAALAACGPNPAPPPKRAPIKQQPPRIETTLTLPDGDGRVHIVAMPTDLFEAAKCLVAVGPNGQAAVSCAPKSYDPLPDATP